MIQINEQKLRQLFKNRSNCYADADDVIQAMDEGCFIETINEALSQHDVIKNEVVVCPKCGCNKMTGDGSKSWCLNSECDFVEAN